MRKYMTVFIIALGFIIASSSAVNAYDYNDWVPLLPESIGGMVVQGDPEGANKERGGQFWSLLRQNYSDGDGNEMHLSIAAGPDAPGIREFETMQQFNLETEEKKVQTLDIEGYKAVLDFSKTGGKSNLLIAIHDETVVVIETASFDIEDDIVSLADDIPLSEIADSVS